MESGVLKTIVVLILLAALAFVAGSMAADGLKQAMVPSLLALGAVVLLCMGRHCWILAFVLPYILSVLDVGGGKIPISHLFCVGLLGYWLVMSIMGYAKMTWNSVPVIDCAVLLFVIYFLSTWFANPVTINAFVNHITDEGYAQVGGAEYVWCISAFLTFIFFSILPLSLDKMGRMLKWVVFLSLFMSAVVAVKTALVPQVNGDGESVAIGEVIQGGRFSGFAGFGNSLCFFMFCKYSVLGIVCSPWKLAVCLVGVVGIAISGFRSIIMSLALTSAIAQLYRRHLISLLFCGVCAYIGVYVLSKAIPAHQMPYGVNRILSAVPGLDVKDKKAVMDAQHSLDWRYEMWEWAMNPSKGYIKNYVWGDGFGLDAREMRLQRININRRKIDQSSNVIYARRGEWHSGWVTSIHRLGYVGLTLTVIFQLIFCVYAMRFCANAVRLPNSEYYYYMLIPIITDIFLFHYSTGSYMSFFGMFHRYAILKLAYSLALKEGYISPMFRKRKYVPLMLRDVEAAQHKEEETPTVTA